MNIGLIGCGKVGTSLFHVLKKNHKIIGVYDIKRTNQQRAVKCLNIVNNASYHNICTKSQALFFATPDDQITSAFKKAKPLLKDNAYVFHFSGLLPSTIFPKSKHLFRASVHPFATFPKIVMLPVRQKYTLFIEGDKYALRAAKQIFKSSYFSLRKISTGNKTKYHLLGVFSSNLLVGLIKVIEMLARNIGWTKKDISDVILPIIKDTINNIEKNGLKKALSGPLERGDMKTIKMHLQTLRGDKETLDVYKTLSLVILKKIVMNSGKSRITELLNK